MQGDVTVTVIGNATGDAELRFTPSGAAVANFTVATNPRRLNKQTQQWEDGEATFYRINVWRQHAENVAESVFKGNRVVVVGTLQNRQYEAQDGGKRYSLEVTADAVALDTKFAQVAARRAERQQGGFAGAPPADDPWGSPPPAQQRPPQGQQGGQAQQGQRQQAPPQDDLWGSPPRQGNQGGGFSEEPPF